LSQKSKGALLQKPENLPRNRLKPWVAAKPSPH
jgi:hypothetical protein